MAMASLRKRGKVWYYRYVDGDGGKREVKGCPDKRATQEMANAAEAEAAKIRAGLIDPKALRVAEAGRRPIPEHLSEFIETLTAKDNDAKHVDQTRTYINRVLGLANIRQVSDMKPSAVI